MSLPIRLLPTNLSKCAHSTLLWHIRYVTPFTYHTTVSFWLVQLLLATVPHMKYPTLQI
jgi:hypothetical protein